MPTGSPDHPRPVLLVVEDDEGLNRLLCRRLAEAGFDASGVFTGAAAAQEIQSRPFDLLLLDYLLPDTNAREFIRNINSTGRMVPFVVMTGHGDEHVAVEMMRLGARDYIAKAVNFVDLLLEVVQRVLRDLEVERTLAAAEDSLRLSEEKYRFLFNAAPVGICTSRLDGRVIDANPTLARIAGRTLNELIGAPIPGLSRQPETLSRLLDQARSSGMPAISELELHRPDGSVIPVLLSVQPATQTSGEPVVFVVLHDISERRQAEVALRESAERLREAQQLGRIGNWLYDLTTDRMEWSEQTFDLFERNPSLGPPAPAQCFELLGPEQAAVLRDQALEAIAEGRTVDFDLTVRLPSGRQAFFHVVIKPVGDDSGRIVRLVGTIQDITARKLAERAVELERDRLRSILETSPDLMYIVNRNWDIEYANPALRRLIGEPEGRKCHKWFHNLDSPCPDCRSADVFAGRTVRSVYTTKPGRVYDILDIPLPDQDGSFIKLGILRDITDRVRVEQELERHRQHLEELVTARTAELHAAQEALLRQTRLATLGQLAGSVAHEIRNPLSSIKNAAWFLRNYAADRLQGRPLRHIAIIEEEVNRANEVITSLLDFARGRKMQPDYWRLGALLDAAVRQAGLPETIRVVRRIPAALPDIFVDRASLITVLANLLSNAAEAMAGNGTVGVTAEQSGDSVRVCIADTGQGIGPEDLPRVFEPLFSTRPLGIGLGLAIVRSFVESNQGTIRIESAPGIGTTAILTLPVCPPEHAVTDACHSSG